MHAHLNLCLQADNLPSFNEQLQALEAESVTLEQLVIMILRA